MELFEPVAGATPIDDISGLIDKSVRTRSQLHLVEAENIRLVAERYLLGRPTRRQAPFNLKWSLRLHREMFGNVWTWAGKVRSRPLNIGIPHHQVSRSLQAMLDDLAYWQRRTSMAMVEQAARLHHRAVMIHPFENGNGRWSRMLANIHLGAQNAPLTIWPEESIGAASIVRNEYLAAVRAADRGDYRPLIELHRRFGEHK